MQAGCFSPKGWANQARTYAVLGTGGVVAGFAWVLSIQCAQRAGLQASGLAWQPTSSTHHRSSLVARWPIPGHFLIRWLLQVGVVHAARPHEALLSLLALMGLLQLMRNVSVHTVMGITPEKLLY